MAKKAPKSKTPTSKLSKKPVAGAEETHSIYEGMVPLARLKDKDKYRHNVSLLVEYFNKYQTLK